MTARLALGTALGIVAGVAGVLGSTAIAEACWPDDIARTLGNGKWYLWAASLLFCHLAGGTVGGATAAAIIRQRESKAVWVVLAGLFVIGASQIIGEWGHPFRFFWSLILLFIATGGAFLGWRVVIFLNSKRLHSAHR